jgi:broad specificity phosphatase PhoE
MTAVYTLRHPETTWNAAQRYQGRLESPWSKGGRRQARLICDSFDHPDLDAVFSSPLGRALRLGRALSTEMRAPLIIDQRLTEIGQSCWEGLTLREIQSRYPRLYEQWYTRPDLAQLPRSETLADVQARSLSALQDVFTRYPIGTVAVVTHSVVIQVLVASSLRLSLQCIHRINVSNGRITTFSGTEAPGRLLALNCTASWRTSWADLAGTDAERRERQGQ